MILWLDMWEGKEGSLQIYNFIVWQGGFDMHIYRMTSRVAHDESCGQGDCMNRVSNKQASLVEFLELQGLQWESPRNSKTSIAGWDPGATNIIYGTFNLVECWRHTQLETGPTLVHCLSYPCFWAKLVHASCCRPDDLMTRHIIPVQA